MKTLGRNLLEIAAIIAVVQAVWSIGWWIKRMAEKHYRLQLGRGS